MMIAGLSTKSTSNALELERQALKTRLDEHQKEHDRCDRDILTLHNTCSQLDAQEPLHIADMNRWSQRGMAAVVIAAVGGLALIARYFHSPGNAPYLPHLPGPLAIAVTATAGVAAITSLVLQMKAGNRIHRGRSSQMHLCEQMRPFKTQQTAIRTQMDSLQRNLETIAFVEAAEVPRVATGTVTRQDSHLVIGSIRVAVKN